MLQPLSKMQSRLNAQEDDDHPVKKLHALLHDDMQAVNQTILEQMQSSVPLIPQVAEYLIAAGGKRLRPLLVLAMARLCDYQGDKHIKLAAAVEFIHTATLLHDDVVDESEQRRGKPSANHEFGNQASVLVGDFLFSRAFELMVETGNLEVLQVLSQASCRIAEGEVLQLSRLGDLDITQDDYLQVIESKTAALFEAACGASAVLSNVPQQQRLALKKYGASLGIAFQIVDDILDYDGDQQKIGKNIGDDFREGKVTLPALLAYQQGNEEEKRFWVQSFDLEGKKTEFNRALDDLKGKNILPQCYQVAQGYVEDGKNAFADLELQQQSLQHILMELLDFIVRRST